jgi:hypothetical protein
LELEEIKTFFKNFFLGSLLLFSFSKFFSFKVQGR